MGASCPPVLHLHSSYLLGLGWFSLTQRFPFLSPSTQDFRLCYLQLASALPATPTFLSACQNFPYLVALQ